MEERIDKNIGIIGVSGEGKSTILDISDIHEYGMKELLEPINLRHQFKFGTEIEFFGANLWELARNINPQLNAEFVLGHKSKQVDFRKWYLDTDSSVSKDLCGETIGGEFSSNILENKVEDYQSILNICNFLKEHGAVIGDTCSNHIHVSINEDFDFKRFLEIFSKVIAIYELELINFFKGESDNFRKKFYEQANQLNPFLSEKVLNLDYHDKDIFYKLLYGKRASFMFKDGINMQDYNKTKQIEFRYPNGSINPLVIKNNIRLCLLLLDAILDDRFDLKELNERIESNNNDDKFINACMLGYDNPQNFYKLVNIITSNELDQKLLISQYQRILK